MLGLPKAIFLVHTYICLSLFSLIVCTVAKTQLDVHLTLNDCLQHHAIASNEKLRSNFNITERISFDSSSIPHITLYLTDFKDGMEDKIVLTLKNMMQNNARFRISSNELMINGPYAMYNIEKNESIQALSNHIVLSLTRYKDSNQTVPDWVYKLPEPTKSKKIRYVQEYGSPNVFDEFDPHITVGYDEFTPAHERKQVLESDWGCENVLSLNVGVGITGQYGTVVHEIAVLPLENAIGSNQ